uniref:Cytochrome P450 n=1 Tax=Kalanchoe fedtschenkoi TaxID=63787 RepID=A0A7N0UE70_KALFE
MAAQKKSQQPLQAPTVPVQAPDHRKLPPAGRVLPHRTLAQLAKRHGSLMLLRLGSKPTLIVSSPGAAQEIFETHDTCFLNRPDLKVSRKFSYGGINVAFTPCADKSWRYTRGLLVKRILSPTRVKTFRSVREEETLLMVGKIEGSLNNNLESAQHVKIQGYDIPSKTRVMVNAWAIGRDPRSWDNPERFLRGDDASDRDVRGLGFEFIPFSAGRRNCPGISYSVPVIELALGGLLHRFDWSLPGGMKLEDLDVSESFGITVARKYPLEVVATAAADCHKSLA